MKHKEKSEREKKQKKTSVHVLVNLQDWTCRSCVRELLINIICLVFFPLLHQFSLGCRVPALSNPTINRRKREPSRRGGGGQGEREGEGCGDVLPRDESRIPPA